MLTTTLIREFEIAVQYTYDEAEPDVGCSSSVEIRSVQINGVEIPLTKEELASIKCEVLEEHVPA